jgi:hypothetical protein
MHAVIVIQPDWQLFEDGARVVRLRRRGMDPAMIATITGHSPQSIHMMLKVYGPVDPTITAAALADSFEVPAMLHKRKEQAL